MRIKIIVINLVTLAFAAWSMFFISVNHVFDHTPELAVSQKNDIVSISQTVPVSSKNNLISGRNATISTSTLEKIMKITQVPFVATENIRKVITPGPLKINNVQNTNSADIGSITIPGVIERTNYERLQNSLSGLIESPQLDISAQQKAKDILIRQYFEHTAPDGRNVADLVVDAGYSYVRVGENLALGNFKDNEDVLTAWMNSPGHRANILEKRYQDIGVGVAYGTYKGQNVAVIVQHFGRPRSSCPTVDDQIKISVQGLQVQMNSLSDSLQILKDNIDTARKNGEYVDNTIIDAYNSAVNRYESMVSNSNNLRDTYNAQVKAFNTCLAEL